MFFSNCLIKGGFGFGRCEIKWAKKLKTRWTIDIINKRTRFLTSIIVWPKKSSDSLVSFCLSLAFRSLSSSHTRTLILSLELWHSLQIIQLLFIRLGLNLQREFLIPFWIEFLRNRFCSFLRLSYLHCNVWIAGSSLILRYKPLSTDHWKMDKNELDL